MLKYASPSVKMLHDPARSNPHDGMHGIMNLGKDLGNASEGDLSDEKNDAVRAAMRVWRQHLPPRVKSGRRTPTSLHAGNWTSSETYLFLRLRGWEFCFEAAARKLNIPISSFMSPMLLKSWDLASHLIVSLTTSEGTNVEEATKQYSALWYQLKAQR